MYKDLIEKMKRENTEGLIIQSGGCRFCGQISHIETLFEWDKEALDEAATELCDCLDAKDYTFTKERKEKAEKVIEKQFGIKAEKEEDREVVDFIKRIAEMVIAEKLVGATVDLGYGIKAKISVTSKGFIKIQRIQTDKKAEEA